MSEEDLISVVPDCDGWIIGDDPATVNVLDAGVQGKLKAAVKWGIGTDNVDLEACKKLKLPISNIPNMFGAEVADVAIGYVIGLARKLFFIDRSVRNGDWPKNSGISLKGKNVGVIGYGDIGQHCAKRLKALEMNISIYDPFYKNDSIDKYDVYKWPNNIEKFDFLIFTCALNSSNMHMLNSAILSNTKKGVHIVNVARGPLIDESALCLALQANHVNSVALDVFEEEPLPTSSYLRNHPYCIFGSHNASNSREAVLRTNKAAIDFLCTHLQDNHA